MSGTHGLYALLVLVTLPPMVPNSALLAAAGALAAAGRLSVPVLVVTLLVSTVLGDMAVFWLGRRSRDRAIGWLSRDGLRRRTLERTVGSLRRHGIASLIAVRFVPAGRGVGGLTAGVVDLPLRHYLLAAVIAESLFVSCTTGLGYLGGSFTSDGLAPLLIGPAVSLLAAVVATAAQWVRRRSHRPSPAVVRASGLGGAVRPSELSSAVRSSD
ncbi:DedA family protein [Streptomyces sp. NPDC002004]